MYKLHEAWLPELRYNKLAGLEVPRVLSGFVIMTLGEDGTVEGVVWGNIYMPLVCKDVVVIFPVREVRLECSGDVLQG